MEISKLLGKTIVKINNTIDEIHIACEDGSEFRMYHSQNCCESVYVERIDGNLNDLLNTPILQAEEKTNDNDDSSKGDECFLWTFYTLATIRGYVWHF